MEMIVISLNGVNVRWKVWGLLGVLDNSGSWFCSIFAGYYLFPGDPDFRWLWVCSLWYLKSLSPLHKPALVASILPYLEWHIGSSCGPSWHSRRSLRDIKMYFVLMSASVLRRSWLGIGGFLLKLSFPFEDAEDRIISSCELFPEEISRIIPSIPEISIAPNFLSNVNIIVMMRRTLVRINIVKMFHSSQLHAKFINFALYIDGSVQSCSNYIANALGPVSI